MRHLSDKHIPVVGALNTYFGEFFWRGHFEVMSFSVTQP